MTHASSPFNVLSCREIKLLNKRNSGYTELSRLCQDFDFSVMELLVTDEDDGKLWGKKYVLLDHANGQSALTPYVDNLASLEAYCKSHLIQLLSNYLNYEAESTQSSG